MEKNTNNYVIKEIFYSNGVTFRKERFNKETGEEITQYFSKNGEFIVEIKNSTLNNNEIIYDIYSQKFLVKKNGKFYDKEVIYTKKIKYYYDAGSIEEEFDDCGRIHGSRKVYDTDGDLYEDSFWQYGKPIGISKTYYKNGKLRSEGYQKYYNYEGIFKWYYESGELHIEENYKNGVLHGERIIYSKNGEIIEKSKYKNGELKKKNTRKNNKKTKMFKIIFIFLLLINLCFSKEIKLESPTNYSTIIGKIKTTKKSNETKIYIEGIERREEVWNDDSDVIYYDYYEEKINILVDNISKNYSIIDIFTVDLNFDDNEEICLVFKKNGKNYIKIYYYSSEDNKFYDFLNEEQNQEIKELFSTDKNFSIDKLKKYLNDKLLFVELDTREFLYSIKKEFEKNLLSENLKFLCANFGNELVYTDNSKNYYVFYYSGTRNIYSLFSYCEEELGKNYYPITGIAYYKNYGSSGDGVIRKVEYKDNKILRESIIQSFEPKISQDIFYDLNTSRVQKEYIYRNGILSKKILYTYSSNGNREKVVENYDDFKQIRNWQKDKNGKLKERYMTEFQELDVSKGQILYESLNTRLYTLYNNKTEKWCYLLMERHPKEWDYFYVKEIFYGTVSDLNLKNGISDMLKDGYTEIYATAYPVSLDSSTQIIEKGYYKKNKKYGMWILNYAGQIYSKVYYINGIPICYWDYDAYDRLTEFGIYINSKRIKISKKRYFYGISE